MLRYNTKIEQMPGNLLAGFFAFKQAEFFEVEDPQERKVVQVKF